MSFFGVTPVSNSSRDIWNNLKNYASLSKTHLLAGFVQANRYLSGTFVNKIGTLWSNSNKFFGTPFAGPLVIFSASLLSAAVSNALWNFKVSNKLPAEVERTSMINAATRTFALAFAFFGGAIAYGGISAAVGTGASSYALGLSIAGAPLLLPSFIVNAT